MSFQSSKSFMELPRACVQSAVFARAKPRQCTIRANATPLGRAIVTGANSGLGKETALKLAAAGYEVIVASRDKEKGLAAAQEIEGKLGNADVRFEELDLADMANVRKFAERINDEGKPIRRLINNAGIMATPPWKTSDGFERQMGVNHLGHFLLTNLLIDLLVKGGETGPEGDKPARIVNVASAAHKSATKLDIDTLGKLDESTYSPWGNYGESKSANILFTRELARRLTEKGLPVTANAMCPGLVDTNLGRNILEGTKWYARPLISVLFVFAKLRSKSVEDGAKTEILLANSPNVTGITGTYWTDEKEAESSSLTRDMDLAKRLWDKSEELTGVTSGPLIEKEKELVK